MNMVDTVSASQGWRRGAEWVARTELLWLAIAAPFLLFPSRWTPLAVLLIGFTWLARWLVTGRLTAVTPLNIPLLLLVGLALMGYLISPAPELSTDKLWGILLQVALYFAIVNSVTTEQGLLRLTAFLLMGISALALLSLIGTDWRNVRIWELPQLYARLPQFDLGSLGLRGSILSPERSLFNPRQVGGVLGALLPLAAILAVWGKMWWLRLPAVLALFSGGVVLLLSQALMGWFGFAVALLAILLWRWRWLVWPGLLAGLALAVVGWRIAAGYALTRATPLVARLLDVSDGVGAGVVLRLDIWSRALAMIRDMPFSGVGLNTFALVQSNFYTGHLIGPEPHAHNLWLQLAVDMGLPGLLVFLWFLAAFFYMSYAAYTAPTGWLARHPGRLAQLVVVGSMAGVLSYVVGGTLDVVTLGAKPLAAWWVMIGLTGAVWKQTAAAGEARSVWRGLIPAGGVILLLLLNWYLLPAARWGNQGLVLAQPALVTARQTGTLPVGAAAAAVAALDEAIWLNPDRAQLWGTRGSLYAWLGQPEAAYADLAQRVQLDARQPWLTYAPFLVWSAQLAGGVLPAEADALWRVYSQWLNRFPQWAENYALVALVYQTLLDNPRAARAVVQQGRDAGAQPIGLLDVVENNLPSDE